MKQKHLWILLALFSNISLIIGGVGLFRKPVFAQTSVTWPTISINPVAGGFNLPVGITNAGDGSGRLFVLEQAGRIRILKSGTIPDNPFLDIADRVGFPSGLHTEEGFLGLAFPPGFGDYKKHFYVFYTNNDGNNQLSRFYLSSNPDSADPKSEEMIMEFIQPFKGHNGGQLAFGPDGYLYIGTGDGGGSYDPKDNAENPKSVLGKILRIDVESVKTPPISGDYRTYLPLVGNKRSTAYEPPRYRIPADNPFVGRSGYREEIWALGLRNPWRFSFDRVTGDLYIADVGEDSYEEIDFQPASSKGGEHYGWNTMEGKHCVEDSCNSSLYSWPAAEYPHTNDPYRCAVTGGFVYRGSIYPGLQGIYFFADYCSGEIWGLQRDANNWLMQELLQIDYEFTSFGEDEGGEIYLVDHHKGNVFQLASP